MRQPPPRPRATWHDPPYRSNTPSDRGALAGHRRHPAVHAAAHAAQQPRRQTVRAAYRRADAVAGHTVFDYCDHRDSRPCNRRTRPTRHRQRGVRGRANRLALGLYQAAANDFRRGQHRSHAGLVRRLAQHVRPVRPHHDLQHQGRACRRQSDRRNRQKRACGSARAAGSVMGPAQPAQQRRNRQLSAVFRGRAANVA